MKAVLDGARKSARPASAAESPPTGSSVDAAKADPTSGAADAKSTESSKSSSGADEGGDPQLAKRLARVAQAEDSLRALKAEIEPLKGELVEYRTWKETRAKDPVAAAKHGLTPDQRVALFWDLNTEVLETDPSRPKDPAEEARRVAREEWERLHKEAGEKQTQQVTAALERERSAFVDAATALFSTSPDKWPAIHALGVATGDIVSHVEAEFERTGAIPDAAAVLDHFERKHQAQIEAAGYTRQKVEAQPGGTRPQSETVTNEWRAGSVPAPADGEMSLHDSRQLIKRKHFKS